MVGTSESQLKREHSSPYNQSPHSSLHHMPPAETAGLHNYHHPPPLQAPPQGGPMAQTWAPTPSPYHEGGEHRPPPTDAPPPPHQQPYPAQPYPPPHQGQGTPYGTEHPYNRQGSVSGPTRSPPGPQNPHYPPPVNGSPHDPQYYPPSDYRNRPYGPPESPANGGPPPTLHVATTGHEMMSGPGQGMSGHGQGQPPPQYGPPHSAGPPPSAYPWGPPPTETWYVNPRRKPVRAAQACDSCRSRKAKCDEGRPECSHCKDNGLKCSYRDVPPQKSEKQVLAITERLESLSHDVKQMMSAWKAQEDKINRILNMQETQATQMHAFTTNMPDDTKAIASAAMVKTRSRPQTKEEPRSEPQDSAYPNINAPFMQSFDSTTDVQSFAPAPQSDSGTKPRGPMGASDLLLWPAIKELVPPNQSVSYVMDGEAERGLLRLYGCGEGEDKGDGHDGAASPANSNSSGRMDDDASTSSPSGVWGTGQLPSRVRDGNQLVKDHPGGVTPEGELLLDAVFVDSYVKSYMDHMYILHPFLDPRVLRRMVHNFKKKHSPGYRPLAKVAQSIGAKRKREMSDSPSAGGDDHLTPQAIPHTLSHHEKTRPSTQPIEHSVSNAIILLVLALGKICSHRTSLPGPVKSSTVTSSGKGSTPHPSLGYTDLPVPPSASAPTSPYSGLNNTNGVSGVPPVPGLQGKNMDVIPGLAYFAKAADILGELPGGVDVSHVQANLLAGLYMGQLARIIPSHWYIANACRACQILIRSSPYKERQIAPERRNLINFAFWSCLQLESDILAEMDIPPSGIIQKEASMLREIPNALTLGDPEQEDSTNNDPNACLRHYSNQIQLRRTLNDAVHNIYNAERQDNRPTKLIETIGENLEFWRKLLGNWDWSDEDHESSDINHARMRGKYYGAKYIINRPALHYALSLAHPSTPISRPSESPLGQSGHHSDYTPPAMGHYPHAATTRRVNEMRPPARMADSLDDWILKACKNCVEAAIKSTTVFDKVPGRMIITNVFGTSHAQFGNVLVLAATFNSPNPDLRSLVKEDILRFLLGRTIKFLQSNQEISPALGNDAKILQYVENKLFPKSSTHPPPGSATSSFSSR